MRRPILLGDEHTHGGNVIQVSAPQFQILGRPIARVGDKCSCPRRGHDGCTIVEGDANWTIEGVPVALEGHRTSCGAILIATDTFMSRDA